MAKTKINKVFIIGNIEEVKTDIRTTADGRDYISGKIVVKSVINDVENLIDVRLFSFAKKKDGTDNKVFLSYKRLDGMLHKHVKVSAELREDSMIRPDGTLNKFNTINLNFVNEAKPDEADCATFEYSGFVVKALYERKNKQDELIGYRMDVAQANYNDSNIQVIKFDIDKSDMTIVQAIEGNYGTGETVSFSGVINYIAHVETKVEEVSFGEPIAKTFVQSEKAYRITGGKEPFEDDDPMKYTQAEISKFIEAYKAADVERLEKAKNSSETEAAPASGVAKMTRPTSLI